jgi:hypothetical protein
MHTTVDLLCSIGTLICFVLPRDSTGSHALSGSRILGRPFRRLTFLVSAGQPILPAHRYRYFGMHPRHGRALFGEFWYVFRVPLH